MPLSLIGSTPDTIAPVLPVAPAESKPMLPRLVVVGEETLVSAQAVVVASSAIQAARDLTHEAQDEAGRDLFHDKGRRDANAALPPDSAETGEEPTQTNAERTAMDAQSKIENTRLKIELAGVEQARRVADCLRVAHELTLTHLAQPCLTLSAEGDITFWNPALAHWLMLPPAPPADVVLADIAQADTVRVLADGLNRLADQVAVAGRNAAASPFLLQRPLSFCKGQTAERVTFVPLCRIPGCLESAIVLIEPAQS